MSRQQETELTEEGKRLLLGCGLGGLIIVAALVFSGWFFFLRDSGEVAQPALMTEVAETEVATQVPDAVIESPTDGLVATEVPSEESGSDVSPTAVATEVVEAEVESGDADTAEEPAVDPYEGLPVIRVGLDAFSYYYTAILIKQMQLDLAYGFNLQLVTFCSTDDNCWDESTRTAAMLDGRLDALLTTSDKLALRPELGQLAILVGQTDGDDMLVCREGINTLNDLRRRSISYLGESIGEHIVYAAIELVQIPATEVVLVSAGSVAEATDLFVNGTVDCVSGWVPDIEPALDAGVVIFDTSLTRLALDVVVFSNAAIENKPVEMQSFTNAWFEALKFTMEAPADAEGMLIQWGEENGLQDWSFVYQPGDWIEAWLAYTPQATLVDNQITMRNLERLYARLAEQCRVWAWAGFSTPLCDPATYSAVVNSSFVETSSGVAELVTTANPVNDTFFFVEIPDRPALSDQQIKEAAVLAQLPFEKIGFLPNSVDLTEEGIQRLEEDVLPVMLASSSLVLELEGSAALPPGNQYTLEGSLNFALRRAQTIATWLIENGVDPDRIIVTTVDEPQFPRSGNNTELEADRFVRFTLLTVGY